MRSREIEKKKRRSNTAHECKFVIIILPVSDISLYKNWATGESGNQKKIASDLERSK